MRLNQFAAVALAFIFVVLWSTGFIGAKYGMPYAEPLTFLTARMFFVLLILVLIVVAMRPRGLTREQVGHSMITGFLAQGLYLGGVFVAIGHGVPAGISALIPGLQPILTSTIANRWMGERVTNLQWLGLVVGLLGVLLVLHDRSILESSSWLGWLASVISLFGITLGTLYQKRHGGEIDWRVGNIVQYATAGVLFTAGAFVFETRVINWTGELVFALAWLVVVLSVGTVALMYWLLRKSSAATKFASLFYLVPAATALMAYVLFGEKLDALSIGGMVLCAAGVLLVNRGSPVKPASPNAAASVMPD